jgi:hypothetical protein
MRPTQARFVVGIALAAACALNVVGAAQAPDPLFGTWKMDVAKSSYKPGPTPKSATVVITAAGKGMKVAVDSVVADAPLKWEYTTARDGTDSPVTGHPYYETVSATQTSPTEGTVVYKKGGKAVVTTKTSVSKDGKMLTVTSTGTDPKGQAMHNVAHYTKQ